MQRWKPFALFHKQELVRSSGPTSPSSSSSSSSSSSTRPAKGTAAGGGTTNSHGADSASSPGGPHQGLRALDITCVAGGSGNTLYFGDGRGKVTVSDEYNSANTSLNFSLRGFRAHRHRVTHIQYLPRRRARKEGRGKALLVTIGDGFDPRSPALRLQSRVVSEAALKEIMGLDASSSEESGQGKDDGNPTPSAAVVAAAEKTAMQARAICKIWTLEQNEGAPGTAAATDAAGTGGGLFMPTCICEFPVFSADFPEQPITQFTVMPDLSMMAVGLANGAVLLFRGNLMALKGSLNSSGSVSGQGAVRGAETGGGSVMNASKKASSAGRRLTSFGTVIRGATGNGGSSSGDAGKVRCKRFLLQAALPVPVPVTALAFVYSVHPTPNPSPSYALSLPPSAAAWKLKVPSLALFVGTPSQLLAYPYITSTRDKDARRAKQLSRPGPRSLCFAMNGNAVANPLAPGASALAFAVASAAASGAAVKSKTKAAAGVEGAPERSSTGTQAVDARDGTPLIANIKENDNERVWRGVAGHGAVAALAKAGAVQFYSLNRRRRRYAIGGRKTFIHWFREYIVLVTDDGRGLHRVSIYDMIHKLLALSFPLRATQRIDHLVNTASGNSSNAGASDTAAERGTGAAAAGGAADAHQESAVSLGDVGKTEGSDTGVGVLGAAAAAAAAAEVAVSTSLLSLPKRELQSLLRGDGDVLYVITSGSTLFIVTSTHRVYRIREKDIEERKMKNRER